MYSYLIAIAGPSGGGKTTTCLMIENKIKDLLGEQEGNIVTLSQDRYYFGGDENTNFDDPKQIEFELMIDHIIQLKNGKSIYAPIYDFKQHKRLSMTEKIGPAKIILIEGILIFTHPKILELSDSRIFVSAHAELCYERRIKRDVKERGRTEEEIKNRYFKYVLPSTQCYVNPSMMSADIVIINNTRNKFIGMNILLDHIENQIISKN